MDKDELLNLIALSMVPKVGPVSAKNLIAYCGSPANVFREKKAHLMKIPGIGNKLATAIKSGEYLVQAEAELKFVEKQNIKILYYLDKEYPARMKELNDAPILLYYKGNANLNAQKVIGVVGTRKATDYGKDLTEKLIEELAPYSPVIVSGLAYGIDYMAHKAALKYALPTIGVMGNGLGSVYPAAHKSIAQKMIETGGLLTEFVSDTKPDKVNFPARNRIVAGLIDALVLVETGPSGGALITGEITNSYNREVFAFPGRVGDEYSKGCNKYIKINKACLVESGTDVAYQLGWDLLLKEKKAKKDYSSLNPEETTIVNILSSTERMDVDTLSEKSGMSFSDLSMLLLNLEFQGIVKALPGKFYRLV